MTLISAVSLFLALLVLAIIPGPGVLAVVARSMSLGFKHGAVTTLGIVAGDFVFIVLAMSSLSLIAQWLGPLFLLVKYLGAAYLLYLSWQLWKQSSLAQYSSAVGKARRTSSFFAGLITTLGNPKAIFFYAGLFPAFVDLSQADFWDGGIIMLLAAIAVGGVMLVYAFSASRAKHLLQKPDWAKRINRLASFVLGSSGVILILRNSHA